MDSATATDLATVTDSAMATVMDSELVSASVH
jgi:hypothetical protein